MDNKVKKIPVNEALPAYFEVKQCKSCGKYLLGKRWMRFEQYALAKRMVSKYLDTDLDLEFWTPLKKKRYIQTTFHILRNNLPPLKSAIRVFPVQCNFCSKRAGGYYEAVLQVRSDRKLRKKELDELVALIYKKADSLDVILRFRELENGFDFEIAPVSFAHVLEKDLRAMGLSILKTAKNVSRDEQTGKDIYRVTICARFPSYSIGELVVFKKEPYQIIGTGRKVVLSDRVGKKKRVAPDDFKYKTLESEEGMIISRKGLSLQVMLSDYSMLDVRMPDNFSKKDGAKVNIVTFNKMRLVF